MLSRVRDSMKQTASSISLNSVMNVLMLILCAQIDLSQTDRTLPRIVPSQMQLFEYTNLTVTCEGFFNDMIQWRVLRNDGKGNQTNSCNKYADTLGACHIHMVYPADSGEYWCESRDRRRSDRVQITVTAANIILESPVRPVMVGDHVTLRCIKNPNLKPSTKFDFYKDGVRVSTNSTGELSLHNISLSDQGLYKCNISEKEFTKENLLQVKAVLLEVPDGPVMEGENVTLFCRDKMASSNYTSFFYKDDEMIGNSSSGTLSLNKVSKTDEGIYKCKTSEDRESEEQWLAVKGTSSNNHVHDSSGATWTPVSGLAGLAALPLVLIVLVFIYKKCKSNCGPNSRHQTTSEYEQVAEMYSEITIGRTPPNQNDQRQTSETTLYASVKKNKVKSQRQTSEDTLYAPVRKKKDKRPRDENTVYSLINSTF